jgi:hypothetical protein
MKYLFCKKLSFSYRKFGDFFQRKIVEFPVEKSKKIPKILNFMVGKIIYLPEKSRVSLGDRVFENLAIYFPELNKMHRILH